LELWKLVECGRLAGVEVAEAVYVLVVVEMKVDVGIEFVEELEALAVVNLVVEAAPVVVDLVVEAAPVVETGSELVVDLVVEPADVAEAETGTGSDSGGTEVAAVGVRVDAGFEVGEQFEALAEAGIGLATVAEAVAEAGTATEVEVEVGLERLVGAVVAAEAGFGAVLTKMTLDAGLQVVVGSVLKRTTLGVVLAVEVVETTELLSRQVSPVPTHC
jgi:hypothetical protein